MSTDAERLLIKIGLPQYTSKLLAANMSSYQSMQARKALIPAIIPSAEHAKRIVEGLGLRGTAAYADAETIDPVLDALEQWDEQVRSRLRTLAERQAALLQSRVVPFHRAARSRVSNQKGEAHDLVAKVEHCKSLLASVHSGKRAHRKYVELCKLLEKYKNRAGDPKEVDSVKQQLAENEAYIHKILVMLEEEGKLHMRDGDEGFVDLPGEATTTRPPSSSAKKAAKVRHVEADADELTPSQRDRVVDAVWNAGVELFSHDCAASLREAELLGRLELERDAHAAVIDMIASRTLLLRCM